MSSGEGHERRETVHGNRGIMWLWSPAPGIFASESEGHIEVEQARAYVRFGNSVLESGHPAIGFHEWTRLISYDTQARREVTAWGMQCIRRFESVNVALESQVVKMGVALANVALFGRITVHSDVETFQLAFNDAVRKRRELVAI